jgi:hypothetical protein
MAIAPVNGGGFDYQSVTADQDLDAGVESMTEEESAAIVKQISVGFATQVGMQAIAESSRDLKD